MTILELQPLTADLLPNALVLDQRALGGLWTRDGYQREINSPNSDLLVLRKGLGARDRGLGKDGEIGKWENGEMGKMEEHRRQREQRKRRNSSNNQQPTTNNQQPPLIPHSLLPTPHSLLLGLGCSWAILEEAHITLLAVDPHYQRQGLGQALLYGLLKAAYERGLERATLEVRVSNQAAILLYEKFGFREAGRRKRYYQDTGEDALVLWRGVLQYPDFPKELSKWRQQICDRLHKSGWQLNSNWDIYRHGNHVPNSG